MTFYPYLKMFDQYLKRFDPYLNKPKSLYNKFKYLKKRFIMTCMDKTYCRETSEFGEVLVLQIKYTV